MNISIFDPSFIWDTRDSIVQVTTLAIPLAIEGIRSAVKIYHNPACVKDNLLRAKLNFTEAFTKCSNEGQQEYKSRLIKNITRIAFGALLIAGGASAAYFLVPSAFSIAAAVIAIQVLGKIWKGLDQIPQLLRNVVGYLKDAFHQRKDESIELFQERKFKAIKNIVKCSLIFAACIATISGVGYIGHLLANAKDVWQITQTLPFQTPLVVFLEYAALGIAHTALAVRAWKKGDRSTALFHAISAVAAVAFPINYIIEGKEIRLHHSFIGLALQLCPWRAVQCLGSVITFDSFLNSYLGAQGIVRGEVIETFYGPIVRQYDYQNALLAHLPFAVTALSSLCLVEKGIDYCTQDGSNR
ncbi:MAG: hypothetical protein P4L16_07010 [Chlamydiales bacterium]|nr:hypothetical protein [Chlamydiales bacterium]